MEPLSRLTATRPDIWQRGLALATALTGYTYAPKLPLPDGTIYACGSWAPMRIPQRTPEQQREYDRRSLDEQIRNKRREIDNLNEELDIEEDQERIGEILRELPDLKDELEDLKEERRKLATVMVPEGAMEWLLHEVGHWLAANDQERRLPNYGYGILFPAEYQPGAANLGDEREWQAWAFEEIIMAPFGNAREFAPPSQRDGAGFSQNGPIDRRHLSYIERRLNQDNVDIEEWRSIWKDWVLWGTQQGNRAPWKSDI